MWFQVADYFSPNSNPYPYGYTKQFPTRVISGDQILELNGEQQQTLIGHTLSYCNDLESALNEAVSKAEGFYSRLVELGDIVPPKSAEELLKEQTEQQQAINSTFLETMQKLSDNNTVLSSTIQKLSDKIDRMEKEDNHAKSSTNSNDSGEGSSTGHSGKGGKGTK